MKTARLATQPERQTASLASHARQVRAVIREMAEAPAPVISIERYGYRVDFGPGRTDRLHRVNKNKECSCGAPHCEAIEAVRQYLQAGGARAPDPPGALPVCPICGGKTFPDHTWDGRHTHEPGWRCEKGGLRHFLDTKTQRIQKQLAENPWLFPPVPGYPGMRREDLLSWEECEAINRKVFLETGYDPTN
jgi:hypothetical protein